MSLSPPASNPRFKLLVVEDEELQKYVKAIKRACGGKMMFDFIEVEFGADAQEALETHLCPFNSLDQRFAWRREGDIESTEISNNSGRRLVTLVSKLQPLHCSSVITRYPDWQESMAAKGYGFEYIDKTTKGDVKEYAVHLLERISRFLNEDAWIRASMVLPVSLSHLCYTVSDVSKPAVERFDSARRFWETGILLSVLVMLKTIDHLDGDIGDAIKSLSGKHGQARIENDACIRTFKSYIKTMLELLDARGYKVQAREFHRFFGDGFHQASSSIRDLRNRTTHGSLVDESEDGLAESRDILLHFLLGCTFWALHPISSDVVLEPHLNRMAARGKPLRGMNRSLGTEVWQWDQKLQVHKDRILQCIVDPLDAYNALLVDLHPLVRRLPSKRTFDELVLAHNPLRDEYIAPQQGNKVITPFADNELSDWWRKRAPK